jgi:hypothetical protein
VSDDQDPGLEPADSPTLDALRRRTMILNAQMRLYRRGGAVPHRPNRPQSGMFDSHGDGHPDRAHYLPAHKGCEPASEAPADDTAPEGTPDGTGVSNAQ